MLRTGARPCRVLRFIRPDRRLMGNTTQKSRSVTALIFLIGTAAHAQAPEPVAPGIDAPEIGVLGPMRASLRDALANVVVVAGASPAERALSGDYDKATPGFHAGMAEGASLGTLSTQIGGVNVNFPVPILVLPGAVYGGLTGAAKRDIQEFRDALAEEIANAESQPLTNSGLALDVFQEIAGLGDPGVKLISDQTPIPGGTDAAVYVRFDGIGIDVQGKEAIITTSAKVGVQKPGDEKELYDATVFYRDRDTLGNWTRDGNALWRDYSNFAAHHLAREIAAELFTRRELAYSVAPEATQTAKRDRKNDLRFVSKTQTPELAWALAFPENDPAGLRGARISWEVEVYDRHRLVYAARRQPAPQHIVGIELACGEYHWSVRPSFTDAGGTRIGEWMRRTAEGPLDYGRQLSGDDASAAPAYVKGFAELYVRCGR